MTYDDAALIPDASCTTVNNLTLPGSRVYTWNDGQTSTFSYTTTIVGIGAQVFVLRTGKIIAGRFTGATAEQIGTVPTLNPLDCLAAGVTNTSADGIVTILG